MDRPHLPAQPQVSPLPALLVRTDGADAPLRFTDTVSVGRDPRCTVVVDHGAVSRVHVRVVREDEGWWICDAHSTNGTYVDGVRLDARVRVDDAVAVRLGRNGPRLHLDLVATVPADAPAPHAPSSDASDDGDDIGTDSGEALFGTTDSRDTDSRDTDSRDTDSRDTDSPRRESPETDAEAVGDDSTPDVPPTSGVSAKRTTKGRVERDAVAREREDRVESDPSTETPRDAARHRPNVEIFDVTPLNPKAAAASVPGSSNAPLPDVDVDRIEDASPESQTPFVPPSPASGSSPGGSVTQYLAYYFQGDGGSGGEHTQLLRQAYARARRADRRPFLIALGAVLSVCVVLAAVVLWQSYRHDQLQGLAEQVFQDLKRQDLALAQLRISIEEDRPLSDQLAQQERERRMLAARYDGYVQELGLQRHLTEEEQIIHRMARVFGESEFSIPAGFIREVRETIQNYWLGPGRARFVEAIERAESNGYTQPIVNAMMDRGLPPEFFYLALQESDFRVDAVGPRTRWGIAKGMWQFIPSTGRRFGLTIGPRAEDRVMDPDDDRHDFRRATRAAARYLHTIYATEAQASGLLVIASYNWGEHRVNDKLSRLKPYGIPDEAFAGMAETPQDRNYWRFLTEYRERIPAETRDYVLKVFAAAVIGSDPQHFGFSFENPLRDAIEAVETSRPSAGLAPPASDASTPSVPAIFVLVPLGS